MLLPVYHKLFNTILTLGTVPNIWCNGTITPIFKSGARNDPSNYRRICVSSRLGKLFFSILNQRLLGHAASLNILHKSQIGFLPKNRTSDHVLTLRTLMGTVIVKKIYACFVDFKKAFDSVWHEGLLHKLLQIDVGGCFYKLIQNLNSNSSCTLKIGRSTPGVHLKPLAFQFIH